MPSVSIVMLWMDTFLPKACLFYLPKKSRRRTHEKMEKFCENLYEKMVVHTNRKDYYDRNF